MLTLDHIVIATTDLAAGAAELEDRLGLPLAPGGQHTAMGTHNRLLSLGPDAYLELIAINPDAPRPNQPRWYALDPFSGPTRLTHWAARVANLDAALAIAPEGTGRPWDLERNALRWRMAIPETGQTPFEGLFPALLQWQSPHPAPNLPDHGLRLRQLSLQGPKAVPLHQALDAIGCSANIQITPAPTHRLSALLEGPHGEVIL